MTFQRNLLSPLSALIETAILSAVSLHFYTTSSVMTGKTVILSTVWHNLSYGVVNRMNPMYIRIHLLKKNKKEIKYCLNLQRSDDFVRFCIKCADKMMLV